MCAPDKELGTNFMDCLLALTKMFIVNAALWVLPNFSSWELANEPDMNCSFSEISQIDATYFRLVGNTSILAEAWF